MNHPRLTALLVTGAIALAIHGTQARQSRIAGGTPDPRTAMIVGQVVDATGAPVPEAMVNLDGPSTGRMPDLSVPAAPAPGGRVMADAQGRYFYTDLPAGDYYLQASKGGYTGGVLGQRRPGASGTRFVLKPGERRADATLTLWKFAVISGTVLDEAGEPVVGVGVRALMRDVVGGRLSFGNREVAIDRSPAALTDDRGQFRLPELLPGTYVVVVPSTLTTIPLTTLDALLQDARYRNSQSVSGIRDVAGLGQPRALQVGDAAVQNLPSVLTPPAAGTMQAYRAVYYPSAASATDATAIVVASGEERPGITIRMQPAPAVRITGRLVKPDGSAPPPMAIKLTGSTAAGVVDRDLASGPVAMYDTARGMSDAAGRFTLLGVPSGEYVLRHARNIMYPAVAEGSAFWVAQPISVGASNLDDLIVELKPALKVEGRVQFLEAADAASVPDYARTRVQFYGATGEDGFAAERQADTATEAARRPNGPDTFGTAGAAGGRYVVYPVPPAGWFVDSVTLDGKDITERPFNLQADVTSLVVTYTNRPSRVSGAVRDPRGAAHTDTMVVVFPVDETRWTDYGNDPRLLTSASLSDTGGFAFPHLSPGDYYLLALEGEDPRMWRDPARLRVLARQATRIAVSPHTSRTVNLVSVRAPQ